MPLPNLFVFYSVFAAIMEFTSNILISSNQQKSFYLMLIICHTRIKVNIIVTILYHFIHLVSISVTAILRYSPLPFRDFAQKRGRRSWSLRAVEIQIPPTLTLKTCIPHIYLPSLSLHYDDAHIKAASSHDPRRVSGLHDAERYDPRL